jgi:hypothetical protein
MSGHHAQDILFDESWDDDWSGFDALADEDPELNPDDDPDAV